MIRRGSCSLRSVNVHERLNEWQVRAAERAEVTVESLIGELDKCCRSPSCGGSERALFIGNAASTGCQTSIRRVLLSNQPLRWAPDQPKRFDEASPHLRNGAKASGHWSKRVTRAVSGSLADVGSAPDSVQPVARHDGRNVSLTAVLSLRRAHTRAPRGLLTGVLGCCAADRRCRHRLESPRHHPPRAAKPMRKFGDSGSLARSNPLGATLPSGKTT